LPSGKATITQVEAAVTQWMRARKCISPSIRTRLANNATSWLRFSGLFTEAERSRPFSGQVDQFTRYMRDERGLASATIASRLETLHGFLSWFQTVKPALSEVELTDVDQYLGAKGRETWNRRTVAFNALRLRAFFRYAEQQGWCRSGVAAGIELPRVYRMESVPLGPTWEQVHALVAGTAGNTPRDLRDRAALLLFAVYGLRCSEVRQLRLDDIDWDHERVTVRRAKCRKTQMFPLTREVGDAIIQYIRQARPKCECREIVDGGEKGGQFGGYKGTTCVVTLMDFDGITRALDCGFGCPAATFVALRQLRLSSTRPQVSL